MYTINRAIIILYKKQAFMDWLSNLPDCDDKYKLSAVNKEPSCYLVPDADYDSDIIDYLKNHCVQVFEAEMGSWWTEEKHWEKDLSWKNFNCWFRFQTNSLPIDLSEKKFTKEDYLF